MGIEVEENFETSLKEDEEEEEKSNTPEVASSHLEERHLIKNGIEESLPLFDEGVEAVKDVAPIASPDYSITEDASVSASLAAIAATPAPIAVDSSNIITADTAVTEPAK